MIHAGIEQYPKITHDNALILLNLSLNVVTSRLIRRNTVVITRNKPCKGDVLHC
jgi:hypothetical protein